MDGDVLGGADDFRIEAGLLLVTHVRGPESSASTAQAASASWPITGTATSDTEAEEFLDHYGAAG
ncbi:hypothetical protein [Arthrobacter sp. CJ23]|uniref:hypothetical protein n=1 Tax=Arthrobacter sp. CJ23 TaxID=2972479 RepID=UPI00215C0A98|nr:hypothetical protein [Arthrobacter sp. CJ23]UVJ41244.1 hypothetical protein NVV90_08885 [Arthrobacter sp. CJ23]